MKFFEEDAFYYDIMLMGICLLYIGMMLLNYIFLNSKWPLLVSLSGVSLFIFGYISMLKDFDNVDDVAKIPFKVLLVICIINILLGIITYSDNLSLLLFNPQYMWMFFMPLVLMIPVDICFLKQLIRWSLLYVVISFLFSIYCFNDFIFNAKELLSSSTDWEAFIINRPQEPLLLLYPISAFWIFYKFHSWKWKILIISASIIALATGLMYGRRSVVLIFLVFFISSILVYVYRTKRDSIVKYSVISFVGFLLLFSLSYGKVETVLEDYLPVLYEKSFDNTRAEVETDFFSDMSSSVDWVFGRGMNGTYRSPSAAYIDRLDRIMIETGYLNMILHGGLLLLIPYVFLLLYAFYKGFFCSNSLLLQSCSIYVLIHMVMLYPEGTPKLTLDYFILFVFIRMCITEEWREISDNRVIKILFKEDEEEN